MTTETVPLPMTKCAFDHPGTRQAWRRARLRIIAGAVLFTILALAVLVLTGVYTYEIDASGWDRGVAVFFGIVVPGAVVSYVSSLRRLGRMRKVLRSHPWKHREGARRAVHVVDSQGIPVQLLKSDGEWSRVATARNPLRWYRWNRAMERGVWLAGSAGAGGVLALPGGNGLMEIKRHQR